MNKCRHPSVTEVISCFIETRFFTPESREIGSAAHDYFYDSMLLCTFGTKIDDKLRNLGYTDSFDKWFALAKPGIKFVEKRLTDESLCFSGKPDFIGTIEGQDGLGLIDYKTSNSYQKHWGLQISAYAHLAIRHGMDIKWGGSLRIRKDGSLPIFNQVFIDGFDPIGASLFSKFNAMLDLYKG